MRKIGKYRRKKQKKLLIVGSLSLLLFLCASYAAFNTNLNLKAKGNIKEKSRVIQAWSNTDQTDFHSDYYKQNIISVTFLDNNNIPSSATESFNVSEDKENGGVMAWVIPSNEDSTKYDLYIGAKGGVIANEDSGYLFYNFRNVETIDFYDDFDTSNVISMYGMFADCLSLTKINLSSFNTSNVKNMRAMFMNTNSNAVSNLKEIVFGNDFNTSNVTNMYGMFGNLTNIVSLDLSIFDTSNVTDMSDLFSGCISLSSINLSNFNTNKVTSMAGMFYNCKSLTALDLCTFDTRNVVNMNLLFANDSNLLSIKVGSNWTTANASTSDMFTNSGVSDVTIGKC